MEILTQEEVERKVLAFVLNDVNNLRVAVSRNVTERNFRFTPDGDKNRYYRAIFKVVVQYYYRFQTLMTTETFSCEVGKLKFSTPTFINLNKAYAEVMDTDISESNFEYLLDILRDKSIVAEVSSLIPSVRQKFIESGDNPIKALQWLRESVNAIEAENANLGQATKTLDVARDSDQMMKLYEDEKTKLERGGSIRIGLPEIDDRTNGFRGGQMIVLLGEVGKGKSTTLLNFAVNAHATGKNILFFSWEMPMWQCVARYMAIQTRIEYEKFKNLNLPPDEFNEWKRYIREQEEKNNSYFIFVDQPDNATLEEMDYHIRNLINSGNKPDAIFVDYLGNMQLNSGARDLKKWEQVGIISIRLRSMARVFDTTIFTAQQVNREGLKANRKAQDANTHDKMVWQIETIADAKATADYADAIIGLSPHHDDNPVPHSVMYFHKVKGRDFHFDPFPAAYEPEYAKITHMKNASEVAKYFGDQSGSAEMFSKISAIADDDSLDLVLPVDLGDYTSGDLI